MNSAERCIFQKSLVSRGPARWKSFATGASAQVVLIGVIVAVALLLPHPLHADLRAYAVVDVSMPNTLIHWSTSGLHEREATHNPNRTKRTSDASTAYVWSALPLPVISGPVPAPAKSAARVAAPILSLTGAAPELPIGPSAIPTLEAPRAQIQAGGFADFHGTAAGGGHVGSGTAGSMRSMASPVVILFKPQPQYTSDALTRKVEGDVLLAVVFCASGSVKVLSVIRGLGYGLDQSAETATRRIRFRPARNRTGIPVDTEAIVRATFDLSYCSADCLPASATE